ncbi:hypothetical protein [Flavobacterium johnsoniae]|uniref:hypothetical protein n=1 Tax=Flavobacterium johnsoniae TaxID=986 RepID=UPI0011EF1501|nr:hypothetical protein [Flavobacterium johnsoniae]
MKKKADNQKTDEIDKTELLNKVRLSINEKCQDWVLFQNGTYIIFDHAETIPDIENEAIKLMKGFGPVYVQTPSEDFDVTDLKKTEGWIVSGHCYGMYTYVNPKEINWKTPDMEAIGLHGRNKRELDGRNPVIIYVNRKRIDNVTSNPF